MMAQLSDAYICVTKPQWVETTDKSNSLALKYAVSKQSNPHSLWLIVPKREQFAISAPVSSPCGPRVIKDHAKAVSAG